MYIPDVEVGDVITDGYDRGEVLKVTPTWVLIGSAERGEERWIHEDTLYEWWPDSIGAM